MDKEVKRIFYTNTVNTALGLISLGIFGVVSFYYFDFPILFSLMKSILIIGFLVLSLNLISTKITLDIQERIWVIILVLTLIFSLGYYFNLNPRQLEQELYGFDNDIDSDIRIIGNNKVRKIVAKYDLNDLIKDVKEEEKEVANADKDLNDIKNEVLQIYNDSKATNENKLDLYIDNISIVNLDYLINRVYLERTNQDINNKEVVNFNFENLKDAYFIKNYFYYEEEGIVITGRLDIDNGITIKIRPKNYLFKLFGV